jgi:hypothetical protein
MCLLDNKKKFMKFINDRMIIKDLEKRQYGEVFTPILVIDEMLVKLDTHYKKKNKRSIFTEKDFVWGDISGCGIGNFSGVLFFRLMKGLKLQIPDYYVRKKHILENMLYLAEFNVNNASVCRQLFNPKGIYRLNLFEGDALELNPTVEWGIERFDVIQR